MNNYQNFIIQLTAPKTSTERKKRQKESLPTTLLACVTGSPAGHQNQSEATPVDLPTGLDEQLERLKSRELDLEELIALGEELAKFLLPRSLGGKPRRSVRELYHLSRAKLKPEEGLRVQIRAEVASLGNLPWEYPYVATQTPLPVAKAMRDFLHWIVKFRSCDPKIMITRRSLQRVGTINCGLLSCYPMVICQAGQ